MRMMSKLFLLLICITAVTMVFIARCSQNIDRQLNSNNNGGMPTSVSRSPGEKALREVMRRKEVEHFRDKSVLQEKIRSLENQLTKVQNEVGNLTTNFKSTENDGADQQNRWIAPNDPGESFPGDVFLKNRMMPDANRAKAKYDEMGRNYGNRRSRNGMGDSLQKHLIRGQSVDYPLLDARMSQDYFPTNRVNNNNAGVNSLGKDRNEYSEVNNFGRRGLGINDGQGRGMNNLPFPTDVYGRRMDPNAGRPRYQRSLFDNDQWQNESRHAIDSTLNNTNPLNSTDHALFIKERLRTAEIQRGVAYKTEYELIPFNRFVFNRIFMVDPGLGKRVVGKPIGSKKKDLNEILAHAIGSLNANRTQGQVMYSHDDFVEGIYRTDPSTGTQYELIFNNRDDVTKRSHSYIKISIVRPFSPPMVIQDHVVNTENEWINIILPLSGRFDTFRIFLNQFINVCIKQDKRVYLTVVYFGTNGLKEVKSMMGKVAKANRFKHMKLITLNEKFTRGRALQIGALNWKHGDVLLFFCDVDIVFTSEFLERCRLNTARGQKVYYPIVFSLYNPNIVYSLQDAAIPTFQDQLVLSKDTGFWRDFGYGMTCQYRSDFLKIKGFDEQITGWGGEDVFLYQKFVRSEYFVIRATDPAIFHLWHEKYCDPTLTAEQYRSCIRSKALNEASHPQLGLLAFKDEINVHRSVSERNILKNGVSAKAKRRHIQDTDAIAR